MLIHDQTRLLAYSGWQLGDRGRGDSEQSLRWQVLLRSGCRLLAAVKSPPAILSRCVKAAPEHEACQLGAVLLLNLWQQSLPPCPGSTLIRWQWAQNCVPDVPWLKLSASAGRRPVSVPRLLQIMPRDPQAPGANAKVSCGCSTRCVPTPCIGSHNRRESAVLGHSCRLSVCVRKHACDRGC
jgi:hypothetical protein